ncbi:MAG TPA: hypothetical protein VHC97_24345 [Thermoanaerobaculia bacterium]|jgi:hypothetical protein|nr:hypothetical protein [Thermoanaerobaculia bacterium]
MPLSRSRRALIILALSLLAALSPALAQPGPRPARAAAPEGFLATLRGGLVQLRAGLLALLPKSGSETNPDGGLNDAGSRLDPDGASAAENEAGSGLNPDGRS